MSTGHPTPPGRRELVSQDEMDALLQGLGDMDASLDAQQPSQGVSGPTAMAGVQAFDVAGLPQLTRTALPGLDAIHQRLARLLVGQLYETLGVEVKVTALPTQPQRYGDCALASADDAHGSLLSLYALAGQGLLLLDNTLAHAWIDLLYGGGAQVPPRPQEERKPLPPKISAIGQRAISRLVQQLAGAYAQVGAAMQATPMARPARLAGLAAPDARVYVCPFRVALGHLEAGFQLWLPHAMLEPMLPLWRQAASTAAAPHPAQWQQRLAQSLQIVPVQLQARWRLPDTPLHVVAALRPGDVITLKGMPQVDDVASGAALFTGVLQPGESPVQLRLHGRAGGAE